MSMVKFESPQEFDGPVATCSTEERLNFLSVRFRVPVAWSA